MTILEAFVEYDSFLVAQGMSLKTRQNYRTGICSLLKVSGEVPVELITFDLVARWQLYMRSIGHQDSTIKGNVCKLRVVLLHLRKKGFNVIDSRDIELPKVKKKEPVWLDYSEIQQIMDVIESSRDKALVAALFASGARISELLQLNRDSIQDGEARIIGKNDKPGVLYFDRLSLHLIDTYLAERRDDLKPLFVSGHYRRITVSRVEQLLHTYSDKAGVEKNVTPHVFRHSYASDLIGNGADIYDVSKLLRHSNIHATMVYAHIKEKQNKQNHLKYHTN